MCGAERVIVDVFYNILLRKKSNVKISLMRDLRVCTMTKCRERAFDFFSCYSPRRALFIITTTLLLGFFFFCFFLFDDDARIHLDNPLIMTRNESERERGSLV